MISVKIRNKTFTLMYAGNKLPKKEFTYGSDVPKDFTGVCRIKKTDSICHYKNGKLHNENGPAIIYYGGDKTWVVDGQVHRVEGPAIEFENGIKSWFFKDKWYHTSHPKYDDCISYNPISGEAELTVEIWKDFVKKLECNE